ncbi:SDR family oxidoreductase [Comamonadaceae bacterium OH2545_COT-014]|nr:SDR family oxidoreductase [Comamonadaceae bacterium OH2545_COT-014]
MPGRLQDRVALVYGAGGPPGELSNGRAAALTYAREGAAVACIDRDTSAAQETARQITAQGGQAVALTADVTSTAQVDQSVQDALRHFGRLDILHNNVGIAPAGGPLDMDEAALQRVMDVNLGAMHRTVRAVLPQFLRQQKGVIVNISSIAAIRWTGYAYFAYYASKAALNQATVALALQYASQGIRANAILPGVIDTPLVYQQISAQYASVEQMRHARRQAVPMKRTGTPWDVAHAAVFLASDEAGFINGVCLPVDGGHSCAIPGL